MSKAVNSDTCPRPTTGGVVGTLDFPAEYPAEAPAVTARGAAVDVEVGPGRIAISEIESDRIRSRIRYEVDERWRTASMRPGPAQAVLGAPWSELSGVRDFCAALLSRGLVAS